MRIRARTYQFLDRTLTLAGNFFGALHRGTWIGLLDAQDMRSLSLAYYVDSQFERHEFNQQGLWDWEQRFVQEFLSNARSILICAAGGGREVLSLAKQGFAVTAFDCIPELIATAERLILQEGLKAKLMVSSPDLVPPLDQAFDGAIIGWGAYMHISSCEKRVAFLSDVRGSVSSGAPLLISFFTRRKVSRRFSFIYRLARFVRILRFSKTPLELGDTLNGTFDHHFTESEIRAELEAANFQMISYRSSPYGHAFAKAV